MFVDFSSSTINNILSYTGGAITDLMPIIGIVIGLIIAGIILKLIARLIS